jgi:uncharacterized MAPEG superfamily protein
LIPIEMTVLAWAVVLGLVHIIAASHSASFQRGYRWTAGARDAVLPPLTGVAGRFARAFSNFSETFPYFAALALAVVATDRTGALSAWGVWLYLGGRLVYLPLYVLGVPVVRSLVWNVATTGIVLLAIALLWG